MLGWIRGTVSYSCVHYTPCSGKTEPPIESTITCTKMAPCDWFSAHLERNLSLIGIQNLTLFGALDYKILNFLQKQVEQ